MHVLWFQKSQVQIGGRDKKAAAGPCAPAQIPGIPCLQPGAGKEQVQPTLCSLPTTIVTELGSNLQARRGPLLSSLPLSHKWSCFPPPLSSLPSSALRPRYCTSSTKKWLIFSCYTHPPPVFLEYSPRLTPLFQYLGTKFLMTKSVLGTATLLLMGGLLLENRALIVQPRQ